MIHSLGRAFLVGNVLALGMASGNALAAKVECEQDARGAHALKFAGGIEHETEYAGFVKAFAQCFPSSYGGQVVINLDSGGGSVDQALKIANWLIDLGRTRPVLTRVPAGAFCISACTYLFLSGRLREVMPGGSFEPHGFSSYSGGRVASLLGRDPKELNAEKVGAFVKWGRTIMAINMLGLSLKSDERFAWLLELVRSLKRANETARAKMLLELPQQRLELVAIADGALGTVMPEVERQSALAAFYDIVREREGEGTILETDPKRYTAWLSARFAFGLSRFAGKGTKWADMLEAGSEATTAFIAEEVADTRTTFARQLWPYLQRRAEDIDVDGLVKLMFSTSILYMRPLTREELCDLNIVNRACD